MNIGELLRERDRLHGVLAEAKTVRKRLRQLNVLIAMYGDDSKVTLIDESKIHPIRRPGDKRLVKMPCSKCDFVATGPQGFSAHNRAKHGGRAKVAS